MKVNHNSIKITFNKIKKQESLNEFDFKVLDSILKNNYKFNKTKKLLNEELDFNLCLYISQLFDFESENKLKWLIKAETKYNDNCEKKYLYLLNFNIGKYYYFHNVFDFKTDNLDTARKYFYFCKDNISNSLYYLGCISLIKQISVNIEERDYKESYQYFRLAVDNNINEAIEQERFTKNLVIERSFKNGNIKEIGNTMKWLNSFDKKN